MKQTYKYLLFLTFYAGSDAEWDMDKGLYLLVVDKQYSESEIKKMLEEVNSLLAVSDEMDEVVAFPISYKNDGANIDTLVSGVERYTNGCARLVESNFGAMDIDNIFMLQQWQQKMYK